MESIIKIGGIELTHAEASQLHKENRYLVTYSHIYQLIERNGKITGRSIYRSKGMTRRGRFFAMTPETIYNVFGLRITIC